LSKLTEALRDFPDERPASATAERAPPARVPHVQPDSPRSAHPLAQLREPGTVRARCHAILKAVGSGVSPHFQVDLARLDDAAERVAKLTLARFPDLVIPFHSRWRHFEAGGVERKAELDQLLAGRTRDEVARAHIDLTVVSVLLDAGAGPAWKYSETLADGSSASYSRSEGLGVASFRAFVAGRFSADPDCPCRADAAVLARVDASVLRQVFQASPSNPMVGLEGRAGLIARLGSALTAEAARDGSPARPGLLWDRLSAGGTRSSVGAAEVLGEVLATMAPIWTSGSRVQGLPGGDVWPHPWAGAATAHGDDTTTAGWVPFHKLSQWLTYSLLEPLQWAGLQVTDLDALTGLPEYRNGGLLLDCGVIVPRRGSDLARSWKPADEFIVEWRALTVALLDLLAERVRTRLDKTAAELPLACILEGGTWAAGREIARERRSDGAPPLKIDSDGTVF
jgi:hypothetical protein